MYAETSHLLIDVERLSCCFSHPEEVVRDLSISPEDKRQILARWASDARSIKDHPAYRINDAGQVIALDEILKAIAQVGEDYERISERALKEGKRKGPNKSNKKDGDDPDDNPPAAPAGAFVPRPPTSPSTPATAI